MTSKSNGCNGSMFSEFDSHRQSQSKDCTSASLDNLKRDRFELLSAYLDGEVTPQERRQVDGWLRADESMQCLYARLLQLRQQMQAMPVPSSASAANVNHVADAVCKRLERRSRRPYLVGGTAAIAALFCAFFSNTVSIPQQATNSGTSTSGDHLALSLDKSLVQVDTDEIAQMSNAMLPNEQLALSLNQPLFDIPQIEEN